MKKFILLIIICLSILDIMLSCTGNDMSSGGINDIMVDSTKLNYCDNLSTPCSKTFYLSFKDPNDIGEYHWYWGEVGPANGNAVQLYNNGSPLQIKVTANYFDFPSSPCDVDISVARCENTADIGKRRTGLGTLTDSADIPSFDANCFNYCCTDNYYYDEIFEKVDDLIGVRAQIRTVNLKLCNDSSKIAHSLAGITILKNLPDGKRMWAQMGYVQQRDTVNPEYFGFYIEINDGYRLFQATVEIGSSPPQLGQDYDYKIVLNHNVGNFDFYFSNYKINYPETTFAPWQQNYGEYAIWGGEIRGHETDMPGIKDYKCYFSLCQYKSLGDAFSQDADFYSDTSVVHSSDSDEWGVERVFKNAFNIWDKNPLP